MKKKLPKKKPHVYIFRENRKEFIKSNELILKSQQSFRSEKHDVFTKEVNKSVLSVNKDKSIRSVDSTETYVYGTSKELICKNEESKCNDIIKQYKND